MDLVPLILAWSTVYPLFASLISALLLLLLGYLLAKGIGFAATFVLKLIQIDKLSKMVGFSALLEKAEIRRLTSEILGDTFYWLVIILSVTTIAQLYGLPVEPAVMKVFSFGGIVFLAAIILGFGLFLASLLSGIIKVLAVNFGIDGAKMFSRVIYYIVVIFAFLAALAELGIKTDVFIPQIGVIIGAFGLAAAIAFGLGCKDMAADFLHNLFRGR